MFRLRILAVALFICSATLLTGCSSGPKRYKVTGNVKYKGTPITAGTITFLDEKGGVAGGAPIKDGAFEIEQKAGLLPGKYKVSISYPDPKRAPRAPEPGELPGEGDPAGGADMSREVKDLLPAKYNRQTELTAEVKEDGSNDFPFDLK
jgi:hypothetical protein